MEDDEIEALYELAEKINKQQKAGQFHPLTCGNNSDHILEAVVESGKVILKCPECDYVQEEFPAPFDE